MSGNSLFHKPPPHSPLAFQNLSKWTRATERREVEVTRLGSALAAAHRAHCCPTPSSAGMHTARVRACVRAVWRYALLFDFVAALLVHFILGRAWLFGQMVQQMGSERDGAPGSFGVRCSMGRKEVAKTRARI